MLLWQAHIEMVPMSYVNPIEVKFENYVLIAVLDS